jgi:hypothetical protein
MSFNNSPPVEWHTNAFHLRLENGLATLEIIEHYPSEKAARAQVEPYLRAWEVNEALKLAGYREFWFEFDSPDIIDRNPLPPPESPYVVEGSGKFEARASIRAKGQVIRQRYPAPPEDFILSPDAETLWIRYLGYLNGREPLAAASYMCLTILEASAQRDPRATGGSKRKKTANLFSIDRKVLDKLGELTSNVGDSQNARKAPENGEFRPHTSAEVAWVKAAIRALILRVGQYDADPNRPLPKLTMADLPKLSP